MNVAGLDGRDLAKEALLLLLLVGLIGQSASSDVIDQSESEEVGSVVSSVGIADALLEMGAEVHSFLADMRLWIWVVLLAVILLCMCTCGCCPSLCTDCFFKSCAVCFSSPCGKRRRRPKRDPYDQVSINMVVGSMPVGPPHVMAVQPTANIVTI